MGMILIRDTTLYFQEVGKGDSLLFIHGTGGDANAWDEQAMTLADEFRCVAYDQRGHTRSPLGTISQPSVEAHADDAAELITALGLAPAIVVGSDRGAEIGLDLVRRYPGLIRGAVLSEPLIGSFEEGNSQEFWATIIPAVQDAPTPRAAVDAFFAAVSGGSWERLPQGRREAARSNHAALLSALTMPPYALAPTDLRAIAVPVRIITGTRSLPRLQRGAATIAEHILNADLVRLTDAGHLTYADQPEAFAAAVRSFARRLTIACSKYPQVEGGGA